MLNGSASITFFSEKKNYLYDVQLGAINDMSDIGTWFIVNLWCMSSPK